MIYKIFSGSRSPPPVPQRSNIPPIGRRQTIAAASVLATESDSHPPDAHAVSESTSGPTPLPEPVMRDNRRRNSDSSWSHDSPAIPRVIYNRANLLTESFLTEIESTLSLFRDALKYHPPLYEQLVDFFVVFVRGIPPNSEATFRLEARYIAAFYLFDFLLSHSRAPAYLQEMGSDLLFSWAQSLLHRVTFSDYRAPSPYDICSEIARLLERSLALNPEQLVHTLLQTSSNRHLAVLAIMTLKDFRFAQSLLNHRCSTRLEVDLANMCGVPLAAIICILEHSPQLRTLCLRECWQLTTDDMQQILRACPSSLMKLDINGCHKVSGGIFPLLGGFQLLKCLRIRDCDFSQLAITEYVTRLCPTELEEFDASCTAPNSNSITDEAVVGLARRCKYFLRVLNLNGCTHISDSSLTALKSCPALEQLHIRRPPSAKKGGITDRGLGSLIKYWHDLKVHRLTVLDISGPYSISLRHLEYLPRITSLRQLTLSGAYKGKRLPERFLDSFHSKCRVTLL
jgi:hypothetical protein